MDLRDHLLGLVAPAREGDEVAPGVVLRDASTELGLRLTFDLRGVPLHVEVSLVEEQRPYAARTAKLSFAYRADNGGEAVDGRAGVALCQLVAARAAKCQDDVLAAIARDAAGAKSSSDEGTRVREVTVSRLLERAGSREEPFFTVSPYVGCLIGCRFCYAQTRVASVRRLEGLPVVPWGSYVDVRVNAHEVLAREIATLPPYAVKFCPIVSDPYHAIEKRYGVTRACLEVLRDAKVPRAAMVLTRARLIERDAALIAAIPLGYGGVSIPTIDDEVRAHFEPRGASIPDRLAALDALRSAGARTFAIVQPMLPGSVTQLADALAARVRSVRIDVLHGVENAADDFADPQYAHATDPAWQATRAHELADALRTRGVAIWPGELPPELIA